MKNTAELLAIMARLRDKEKGCPWDLEQNFKSIVPHTIEEAYEVAEAIAQNDMGSLRDELGDLLLQVVFYAQMAKEEGLFAFEDVAGAINDKLIRRHPHIFGDADIKTAEDQTRAWEAMKAKEREAKAKLPSRKREGSGEGDGAAIAPSILDDISLALPALTRAVKLQNRAAKVGFDWPHVSFVFDKLEEEVAELKEAASSLPPQAGGEGGGKAEIKEELGDILFVCANLARHFKVDPEDALRGANRKFTSRFQYIERALAKAGKSPEESSLEEMDALWDEAKERERAA